MNFIRYLENRIRGWLPQEPKLRRRYATTPSDNDIAVQEPDYYSLRMRLGKKTLGPVLGAFIAGNLLLLYLALNKTISYELYSSTSFILSICTSCYYGVALDFYVKRDVLRCHKLYRTIMPVFGSSVMVFVVLWFLAVNSLISFVTLAFATIGTVVLSGSYYLVLDLYIRWKLRRTKQIPPKWIEVKA
jgi:hypothetical protein